MDRFAKYLLVIGVLVGGYPDAKLSDEVSEKLTAPG
jgi:hypothetical protein